ncbi:MAG: hypothetical protein UU48_C0002G0077 [Candidatus Uhrbacteria bacterium GW2011_GWF2_41_16]|jgi:hypothetical protein|uniref:Uncharacterized protein n=2 Tax=Candidatus Uhriibacteriota TaxID=1752732 RepID=A0A0G0YE00_9BACT|nr:MAG: hypothetical protein UU31_C0003G0085 [Candidatus Uhrbacteria bacterium GW2011_GWA2_41_10]KKR87562.1 MAG: hypothetical protein UU35_C0002G0063 [Candidatus Uhrbacteria bacterium GW2011_GWC2_41_11]KKR98542.1 MAG: hypothetical protein UU48_C0002G0077 [Candidatus Uhrbacteria bacterium GW2011_GWF2_41_16]HBO99921.1 hypothetical protein [Candidatus Uhrbacteria bacterium]
MFESHDILFIVLAFCALWFTAFICWLIWQVAMILRNINETMTDAREKMAKIEEALTGMRNRFEHLTSGAGVFGEGIKRLLTYAISYAAERKMSKKTGKKKEDDI